MISAELQHNPYLLETNVKFNGQSPKINSQIEKYENQLLSDWVNNVPRIFYDEMNGYDFDLIFSGTEYDFQKLNQAFVQLGVTSEQVRLIMRNELEDAEVKSKEIREMIDWLRAERNRQFDFDAFYDANKELFEETFSCVVVRGMDELTEGLTFTIENVKNIEEIEGTNLTYVPVVFVVEENTLQQFRDELTKLFARKDVDQKQLFFYVSPSMDQDYIIRFICDLGVKNPQLISKIDDGNIAAYIKNFPMVAHVREVIQIVENEVNTMAVRLKEQNEQSAVKNNEVYDQIAELEEIIANIKETDVRFVNLDNYSGGNRFNDLKGELESLIRRWKSRKTKVVGESDIDKNAAEYEQELLRCIGEFYKEAIIHYQFEKERLEKEFNKVYLNQPLDSDYKPEGVFLDMPSKTEITGIKDTLVELKEEHYEEKTDLLDFFKSKYSSESKELILTVTCYYEKWREKAIEIIIPVVENYIAESQKKLQDYYDELAKKYHEKLSQLHDCKMEEKNSIASQLSEDERMLQEDNDWLIELKDQLGRIERG
ncbi:hypothetical protein D7V86_14815 [bacterium D16-51]|nr:hypothetical protein D7V96_02100 [bacterium D16-59]RKI58828.1 hypothetical protein D7V86_14815 [bacterium D16-51]